MRQILRQIFALAVRSGALLASVPLLLSLVAAVIAIRLTGHDVGASLIALWTGSTGFQYGFPLVFDQFTGARIAAEATPLLLCGLAVAVCLRGRLFNVGAAGQMAIGAFASAVAGSILSSHSHLYPLAQTALAFVSGCLAGGLCGMLVGWLKAFRNVHEIISTIMFNYIVVNVTQYLVTTRLRDPNGLSVQTRKLSEDTWLTLFIPGTYLNAGALIALLSLVSYLVLVEYTAFGFRIRALGAGMPAARASGIPISRTIIQVMALGGMFAGAAGAVQVLGVYHRYLPNVAGSYGFQGIAVALLANGSWLGILLYSLFFGGLNNGASIMQLQTGVPASLISVVQAVIILGSAIKIVRSIAASSWLSSITNKETIP